MLRVAGREAMDQVTPLRSSEIEAAEQYLTWALEEIEKCGHLNAARHTRSALNELLAISRMVGKTNKQPVYEKPR
jgi:hypothetical protein